MVYLLLAICSSVAVSVLMRLSARRAPDSYWLLSCNYLVCLLIAACFTGFRGFLPQGVGFGQTVGLGIINGAIYLISFVLYQHSVKKNGMVLSSTFMKLGLLVPIAISLLVFRQIPAVLQVIGFLFAVGAIILLQSGKAGNFSFGLIVLLITGGGANAMSEIFEEVGNPALSSQFLLYTFLAAFLLCLAITFTKKEKPCKESLLYGFLIGIPNYFSARFLLLSLDQLPAVVAHPTYSAVSVCVVSGLGVLLFREHLTKRQWLGMVLIVISLVLLNI